MKNKKKKTIGIAAVVVSAVGMIAGNLGYDYISSRFNSIDKQLMRIAGEMNESLPMMLDSDTRINSVIAGTGKTMKYNMTLVNYAESELVIDELKEALAPTILNVIKTSPSIQPLRDEKVTFAYVYYDNEGVFLFELEFGHEDYGDS